MASLVLSGACDIYTKTLTNL